MRPQSFGQEAEAIWTRSNADNMLPAMMEKRLVCLLVVGIFGCAFGFVLGGPSRALAQGVPSMSIDDKSVTEGSSGQKTVTFTVRLSAPSATPATVGWGASSAPPDAIRLPPANGSFDYQLGGAYAPPAGVVVLSRDRNDAPAPGLYNICYVNGFQVQPGEEGLWEADLILRDANGDPIVDPDWDEMLLDVSTADKRTRVAAVVGGWIQQCHVDGFDAVEVDNLDSYSRSGGRLSQDNAVALMALLSGVAHDARLAIAQKNSTEILGRRAEMGTDFAVAEECSRYSECGEYVDAYGEHVLMIEYRESDFSAGCATYGATHGIVRRDRNLVTPGNPAYVYAGC
jgi:hypothetical protein